MYSIYIKYRINLLSRITSLSAPRQLSEVLLGTLNQNLVQFTLRPGVQVTVYAAHLSAGKLTQQPGCVFTAAQVDILCLCSECHRACRLSGDLDVADRQLYFHSSCRPSQLITPTLCLIGSHHVATQRHSESEHRYKYVCLFLLGMLLLS